MLALQSTAAYGVEDMQLASRFDMRLKAVLPSDIFAFVINVDVWANLALFGEYAVAKRKVLAPERCEQIADRFVIAGHTDLH